MVLIRVRDPDFDLRTLSDELPRGDEEKNHQSVAEVERAAQAFVDRVQVTGEDDSDV